MNKMKIDIWSDIACPFCYIGKRKLEMALSRFPHKENVELVWHSYELDPRLPKQALQESIYTYFARKYSMTEEEARENMDNTARLAKEVDLNYDFDKLIVANTSDALRLVKLAKEYGLATEAEEILFKSYFVEGKNISDLVVLSDLGSKIGLKESEIKEMLNSDKYLAEIKQDIEYSENELQLEYIPFYVFNNKQIVQGSIAVENYLKVLHEAYSEWSTNGASDQKGETISGQSCSIDGVCS
ncbi:DsbA family oxidoreductase [Dysgonomonas sp. BGC7]|uniref:DsbA family oxidoreductase n=2 Tax=Dysgonomonas sp. BGC7 TaxID=1658008 RepID=UPI00067F8F49|nr:DsbA family oxidoreductase [Dysgonomonas sp. BGC7]MBD8389748.1 DsbA family oxidoreductase [Dysgonomonas sp. BGC7]